MITLDRLPYILFLAFSATVSAFAAIRALRSRRKVARAASFAMIAFSGSLWMILVALDNLITSLAWREVLWWLIPFAIYNALMALFNFSLEFSLRLKGVPKAILFTTVTVTLALTVLGATNGLHHLMWTVTEVNGHDTQVMGPFFLVGLAYVYLLALGSLTLLVRAFLLSKGVLHRQTGLLMVGILIPILVSIVVDVFGLNPLPYVDIPALTIIFPVILFGRATLQFNNFYLLPVASDVIIKNMLDGVLVTDIEGLIIFSNPAFQRVMGKTDTQLNGLPVDQVLADWMPEADRAWNEGKKEAQLIVGEEEPQYLQLKISQIVGNSGEFIGHLLTLNNNTEQKNFEKRLNELAICDPLTGSYNRRYFYEMAHAYFSQMLRSARPLSFIMIDLDHFKNINDIYGHLKGDVVLQKVVAVCKSLVRTNDIFTRYGGEEFILAMPDTSLENALMVAERLRKAIEALKNDAEGIPVTASIGVVETTGEPELTLDVLLSRVDEAMYLSKRAGRNRVTAWNKN